MWRLRGGREVKFSHCSSTCLIQKASLYCLYKEQFRHLNGLEGLPPGWVGSWLTKNKSMDHSHPNIVLEGRAFWVEKAQSCLCLCFLSVGHQLWQTAEKSLEKNSFSWWRYFMWTPSNPDPEITSCGQHSKSSPFSPFLLILTPEPSDVEALTLGVGVNCIKAPWKTTSSRNWLEISSLGI